MMNRQPIIVKIYGDDDETIVKFAVIEYKDGQYIGKIYLCDGLIEKDN